MDVQEKFDKGEKNCTYQRIDPEYRVNIFLGYNDNGQMSMVITEFGKFALVKSSKLINVSMKLRNDGRLALSFDFLYGIYKSMFIHFCKDMISCCEKAGQSMAISSAVVRWKYWKELFGKKKQSILEKMVIKGLIGELLELKNHLIREYGVDKAVYSWLGPLHGHKDFEINDTWYEVKTINENALQVTINSLEQLDSEIDGHLVITRLEDTSEVNEFAINLNQIVLDVMALIENPTTLDLFHERLNSMGYSFDPEYYKYSFMFKGSTYYSITRGFPRFTRNNVPEAIGNMSYTILINALTQFREN